MPDGTNTPARRHPPSRKLRGWPGLSGRGRDPSQRPQQPPIIGYILASSAYVMEIALVPLILPDLQQALGLSLRQLALIANIYAIAVVIGVVLGGWMGDRIGASRVFVVGAALFLAGSVAVTLASGLDAILAARLVQGFGAGLFSPVIPVLLARSGGDRPGRVLSLWYSFSGFVVALAPLVTAPLVALYGWRAVFLVIAVVIVPAIALTAGRTGHDPPCTTGRMTGIRLLLRRRRCVVLFAYVAFNYGSMMLFLFEAPLQLAGASAPDGLSAVVLGAFWAGITTAGILMRNAVDGRNSALFLLASPIVFFAGFATFLVVTAPVVLLLAAFGIGVAFTMGNTPSTAFILRHAPVGTTALASSVDIIFARLGTVAIIALIGPLDLPGTILGLAGISALTVILALALMKSASAHPAH